VAMKTPVAEDTQTELAARRTHDRDDDQKQIDTWTGELVKEYDEAGRPGEEDYAGPTRRFATDDGPDGKRRVARAFALVNHDRKDGTPKLAALWFKNSKPDAQGYVTIKYGARVVTPTEAATADAKAEDQKDGEGQKDGEKAPFEPTPDQPEQPSGRRGRGFGRV
jgi:hypothetical protein